MSRPILVIDDESAIRRLLGAVLERGGLKALEAANGREALALLHRDPLAAIVDLRLPDIDGLELIPRIAEVGIPVLVLSAELDTAEKVAALDLGADDYVTKPFDGDELLARLRVLLRRTGAPVDGILRHGPITIDGARHRASLNDSPIALTPREFALLEVLVEGGGRIRTHAALLEKVWGKAHVHDIDYLRVAIRALRAKIETNPSHPKLVLNEPGIGYRLAE
ncbi:response regulator transcription factor [Novosphingopyxis sp. YJ-S2-01]|uniref:response regulator transcription factor n=1 Tax=Novosphingopyxis sp. YJ-S2-01 TaxID=2794021 RepID=UPI0018DC89C5|nr:response regulator transcription factor [Novosphingopyxis sp. YJ-S2-01]